MSKQIAAASAKYFALAFLDASGIVAVCTVLIRARLFIFDPGDGWTFGAINIGIAVLVWGTMKAAIAAVVQSLSGDPS